MAMTIETIRKRIEQSGKTRYQICQETGVSEAQLCRVMQGGTLRCDTADILLEYFGLVLKPRANRRKAR